MSYILASLPKIVRGLVRREYTQNMKEGHGEYLPATIIGARCVEALSLQFQVRFDGPAEAGAMFTVPIQALAWKKCKQPPIELVQPWDVFSSDFSVHEFSLLRNGSGWILNRGCKKYAERIASKYICTIDFTGNALADDFEQHKQVHIVQAEGGWLAALPNNRWLSEDSAFAKVCETLPRFQSLAYNFSAECQIGLP